MMVATDFVKTRIIDGDAGIADALTSRDRGHACFGRLVISTASQELITFIETEVHNGTDPVDLLNALSNFFGQTMANVQALRHAETDRTAAKQLGAALEKKLLDFTVKRRALGDFNVMKQPNGQ